MFPVYALEQDEGKFGKHWGCESYFKGEFVVQVSRAPLVLGFSPFYLQNPRELFSTKIVSYHCLIPSTCSLGAYSYETLPVLTVGNF